jgi:hypothetical protein
MRERIEFNAYSDATMATKTKRSGQDRKRVSKQKHELGHTGSKVAKKTGASRAEGKRAVVRAKKETRSVSRPTVEKRAEDIAS